MGNAATAKKGDSENQGKFAQLCSLYMFKMFKFQLNLRLVCIVKLANSASSFKFCQIKFPQKKLKKAVLRMIKCVFHEEKLDPINTAHDMHFIILNSSLSWDFHLAKFEKTGGIS